MRFLFDGMDDLMPLFLTLGLSGEIVPFPMHSGGNNRLYFRGVGFDVNEAAEDNYAIWSELYNLAPAEQGVNPKDIINVVFNRILQANPQFTDRPENRDPKFWLYRVWLWKKCLSNPMLLTVYPLNNHNISGILCKQQPINAC